MIDHKAICRLIEEERKKQDAQWEIERCKNILLDQFNTILAEEVGEIAREVNDARNLIDDREDIEARLRTELIQVAAVVVKWLEMYRWVK